MSETARDSRSGAAERLAAAALDLALEAGLEAVTARAVAERAGASVSATNYHFGGLPALTRQVRRACVAHCRAWRAANPPATAPAAAWSSQAARMAAAMMRALDDLRPWLLLMSDFWGEAEAGFAEHGEDVAAEAAAWTDHWRAAAQAGGARGEAAEAFAYLAQGLVDLLMGEPDAAVRAAWIIDPLARLEARLSRAPLAGTAPDPAVRLLADAPSAEGARKILAAAIAVIGERGVARMTQREVAAKAGLSLAATTYFFRTKSDLVRAAFHELHRQVRLQVLEGQERRLNWPTLGADLLINQAGRVRALSALVRAAARDPALRPLAEENRATRGATSLGILRASGVEDADGLDAFLWSTLMGAVFHRARLAPAEAQADVVAAGDALLPVVFEAARP